MVTKFAAVLVKHVFCSRYDTCLCDVLHSSEIDPLSLLTIGLWKTLQIQFTAFLCAQVVTRCVKWYLIQFYRLMASIFVTYVGYCPWSFGRPSGKICCSGCFVLSVRFVDKIGAQPVVEEVVRCR